MPENYKIFVHCSDKKFVVLIDKGNTVLSLIDNIRETYRECFGRKLRIGGVTH